jgi:GNAT superfamily N-acetyltransferase
VTIEIRTARDDEYAEIGALLQDSYRQYIVGNEDQPAWRAYFDVEIPDVAGRLPDGVPIVALVDGDIAATVTYYGPGRGSEDGWTGDQAAIRLLGVPPRSRGLGLGRVLTEECISRARTDGARAIGLHNHVSMSVARAMYLRMGFVRFPQNDFAADDDTPVEAFILEL